MSDLFDRLEFSAGLNPDDVVVGRKQLAAKATHVINLAVHGQSCGGVIAVLEDELLVSFVVLVGAGDWDDDEWFERVFHGSGPSGSLRELRHTFWGESDNAGYIFYPNAAVITDAFSVLKRWFDCD